MGHPSILMWIKVDNNQNTVISLHLTIFDQKNDSKCFIMHKCRVHLSDSKKRAAVRLCSMRKHKNVFGKVKITKAPA